MSTYAHRAPLLQKQESKTEHKQPPGCLSRICPRRSKSRVSQDTLQGKGKQKAETKSTRAIVPAPDTKQNGVFQPENSYRNGIVNGEASEIKQGKSYAGSVIGTAGSVETWKEQEMTSIKQESINASFGDKWSDSPKKPVSSSHTEAGQKDFRQEDFKNYGEYMHPNSTEVTSRNTGYLEEYEGGVLNQKKNGESKTKNTTSSPEQAGLSMWDTKQKDVVRQVSVKNEDKHTGANSPKLNGRSSEQQKGATGSPEQEGLSMWNTKQKDVVRQGSFRKEDKHTDTSSTKLKERSMSSSEHVGLLSWNEKQKDFVRSGSFDKDDNYTDTSAARMTNGSTEHIFGKQQNCVTSSPEQASLSTCGTKQKDVVRQVSLKKEDKHTSTNSPKINESKSSSENVGLSLWKEKEEDFVWSSSFNKDDNYTDISPARMTNGSTGHTFGKQQKGVPKQERKIES
ncbi:hypothetical protein CUMW_188670 [Citrus unshiu]|nr:hypothetical protein CUMW_188670 [Citrus unshiu]